jgi:hypothetical protein
MIWSLNPVRGKRLFSSPRYPDFFWGPLSLLFDRYCGSFLEVRQPRHEVDHLPVSSANIKNELYPVCFLGIDRYNFIFLPGNKFLEFFRTQSEL